MIVNMEITNALKKTFIKILEEKFKKEEESSSLAVEQMRESERKLIEEEKIDALFVFSQRSPESRWGNPYPYLTQRVNAIEKLLNSIKLLTPPVIVSFTEEEYSFLNGECHDRN